MSGARRIVGAVTGVSALSALGRIPGLLIPFMIAVQVGVSPETDAFFFAFTLAMFATTTFTSAAETVVVPFLSEHGGAQTWQRIGAVFRRAAPLLVLVVVGLVLVAGPLIERGTALPGSVHPVAVNMLRLLSGLVAAAAVTSLFGGALNARGAFALPAISPGIRTGLALLLGLLFAEQFGMIVIVYGLVIGEMIRLAVVSGWARRRIPADAGASEPVEVAHFFSQASWQVMAMVVLSANPVINRVAATFLSEGAVTLLEYAERLWFIPVTLLTTGLGPVLLTRWVQMSEREGESSLRKDSQKLVLGVLGVTVSVALLLAAASGWLIPAALGHGAFPAESLDPVRTLFMLYLLSLPTYIVNTVIAQVHIATRNTRVLLGAAVVRTLTHLVGLAVLLGPYRLLAIPLAQSGATLVSAVYLWRGMARVGLDEE